MDKSKYNILLQCNVLSLNYNFENKKAIIFFPDGDCCDMSGVIKIFTTIDKCVEFIETFSGKTKDTGYKKIRGKWVSVTA